MGLVLLALLCATATVAPASPSGVAGTPAEGFVGSDRCRGCHESEWNSWRGSHHDLAMQAPDPGSVLGDFSGVTVRHDGIETYFFRDGDRFMVRTPGPDGEVRDFPVRWTFGNHPLQQYLLPLAGGRLQAFTLAWDSRPAAAGGQRWYSLYPQETLRPGDPLHWTGPFLNWNGRCGDCHSTGYRKAYDDTRDSFKTTFSEPDVACEACHGPARQHVLLAGEGAAGTADHAGFSAPLPARGAWALAGDGRIAQRTGASGAAEEAMCGRCHARRSPLLPFRHGAALGESYRLQLPTPPAYHEDGQIDGEVFVLGSFLQSRMHGAGVSCGDCHEPHGLGLRSTPAAAGSASRNSLCARCHRPGAYDTPQHHGHAAGTDAGLCISCHMPARTYMGTDVRHDHSFRIPRPDLSQMLGTPNACTDCHDERTSRWASDALRARGIDFEAASADRARLASRARAGDRRVLPALRDAIAEPSQPPIWRATLLEAMARLAPDATPATAQLLLAAREPLLRRTAVESTRAMAPGQRRALLEPLVDDPVTEVRMAVAQALADAVTEAPPAIAALFEEYRAVQRRHLDLPETAVQLAAFERDRGRPGAAEALLRRALAVNPDSLAAWINLADLLRATGRDPESAATLAQARERLGEQGALLHALGLQAVRDGDRAAALELLEAAAHSEPRDRRHGLVYAVALHDLGYPAAAIDTLEELNRALPGDAQTLSVLAAYLAEEGRPERARAYREKLSSLPR